MYLCRLGFISEPTWQAACDDEDTVLKSILSAGQKHNPQAGITGVLVFDGHYFCQVMEGRRNVLQASFEKIRQDPRHHQVELIGLAEISDRAFNDWSVLRRRNILKHHSNTFPCSAVVSFEMLVTFLQRQRETLRDTAPVLLDGQSASQFASDKLFSSPDY